LSDTEASKGATHGRRDETPLDHFPGGGIATHGHGDRDLPGSRKVEVETSDPTCPAMMTVEVEVRPFFGGHRARVSVERTPLPTAGNHHQ
jgi:hypothetical protein